MAAAGAALMSAAPDGFDALAALPPVAEARFACARHGTEAGVVRLHGGDAGGWMVTVGSFVADQRERVGAPGAHALRDAVARGDVRRIHSLDPEWVPFYCPQCEKSYCGACWTTSLVFDSEWENWLEEMRGTCPEGHERMLSD
jgi:hypothetical protein